MTTKAPFISGTGSMLVGLATGLHGVALWRSHVLLAGDAPALGAALAVAGSLVFVLPRLRSAPSTRVPAAVLVGLATLLGAFLAPLLFARLTPAVTPFLAACVLASLGLALVLAPERRVLAGLAGAGGGALIGSLLVPFTAPLAASLLAAVLASVGVLLPTRPAPEGEPRAGDRLAPLALAIAVAIPLAMVAFSQVGGGSHPWTSRPAQAGLLLLGLSVGGALAGKLPARASLPVAVIGLALGVVMALSWTGGAVDRVAGALATSTTRPAVGVASGILTLMAGAALLAFPAGLGGGLVLGASRRPSSALAGGVLSFLAATLALAHGPWQPRFEVRSAPAPSRARLALVDGHAVAWDSARRLPEDLLAGHLAALLASGRGRACVLGWEPGQSVRALQMHGFREVVTAGPAPRGWQGLSTDASSADRPDSLRVRGLSELADLGPVDVLVSNLDDPTLAAHEAFFTPAAHEVVRRLLLPGGIFVQRLSVERLGPEGLLRHVLLLRESFPDTWIATADLAHGGSVLAVCLGPPAILGGASGAPAPRADAPAAPTANPESRVLEDTAAEPELGAPRLDAPVAPSAPAPVPASGSGRLLPFARLTSPDRLTDDVQRSLRDARLLNLDDLLGTFAAGPAEISALSESLEPLDPWAPGSLAFRHPAPGEVAADLARAMLYGRLSAVDVRFDAPARPVGGPHPLRWDFLGLDTRLDVAFEPREAVLRYVNHLGSAFGRPAVSRISARRLVLEAPGRRLEIRQRRMAEAKQEILASALADLEGPQLLQSGGAVVHGHPALWMAEQDGIVRQELTLAWHCPARASLYTAELVITADVRPGLLTEPLRILSEDIRCHGPAPPRVQDPSATPAGAPGRP